MRKKRKSLKNLADLFDNYNHNESIQFHRVENVGPRITFDELDKVATSLLSWSEETPPEYKLSLSGIDKKLKHNDLTGQARQLINDGLMNEDAVHNFLMTKISTLDDNDYPIKICGCLLHVYNQFHAAKLRGNELLQSMCNTIVDKIGDAHYYKAVMYLIAYFFARCDIFEPYPGEENDRAPTQKRRSV